jgi:serine/threonine-protein kinase
MALQIGDRVGDYEIQAMIGAGGMGRVYKVRNRFSNREEAMKVLLPDLNSERDLAARFMMEIRTLASLDHPNIAQLRTAFQFENQLVMIMEYVEGVTLEKLAGEGALPIDRDLDYATQVLSALSYAHSRGVIHRDIKPANIMITTHGQVKLMDFGIAKNADEMQLTRPGMTIGSVYYMSPEQVRGGTVDARSDLYSFGVTLYESLTGRKPFEADTSYSVLNAHLTVAPVPPIEVNPALPPQVNQIILRALEKKPEDRFQTAQEFHDALKALRVTAASGLPVAAASVLAPGFAPLPSVPAPLSATSAGFTPVSTAPIPPPPPPPPSFQTVAAAAPPPFVAAPAGKPVVARATKSHRGLWIGLGALAAVLALVAVAWALPHVYAIFAKQKAAAPPPDQTTLSTVTPAAAPQPSTLAPDATTPASSAGSSTPSASPSPTGNPNQTGTSGTGTKAAASGSQHRPAYSGAVSPANNNDASSSASPTGTAVSAPPEAPAGPSPQEVRRARDCLSNLVARSEAASAGVASIRSEQQRQGLDIRGDILAAMNRLSNNLREAQAAIAQNDLQAADEYMERADKDTATLEKFLGR